MQKSYLELKGISKRFPGVQALDNVDFDVRRGEVHALVGENGAGKSTLMNVLGGTVWPDEGSIMLDGEVRNIPDPIASMRLGIGFVHQESSLLPNLTVRENVFLARERLRGGLLDARDMNREILRVSERFGYHLNPDDRISSLTLAEQQSVEITRAVLSEPRLLILDEPTNHLDIASREWMEDALSDYEQTLIFVSHDRYFIEKFATRILYFHEDGSVTDYRGGYREFSAWRERQQQFAEAERAKEAKEKKPVRKPERAANQAKSSAKVEREIEKLEAKIASLNEEAETAASDYLRLMEIDEAQQGLEEKLESLYEQWEALNA